MTKRATGIVIAAAVVAVLLVAGAVWFAQAQRPAPSPAAPSASGTPSPTATGDIGERVQSALDRRLAECAESTGAAPPEHCGIRIPWGTDFAAVSDIRFHIEALPVVTVGGTTFTAAGGRLVATVSGTGQDGAARTETYRTDDWAVRGDLITDGGDVDVSVW